MSMPESLANGHYIPLRAIGNPGMSEVYLCEERGLVTRLVVAKLVRIQEKELDKKRDRLENFKREVGILMNEPHPRVVPIFYQGQEKQGDDILAYMVMRYCEKGSLQDWFWEYREGKPLQITEVSALLDQAGTALQHLHDRGIIHRDIKSTNFLVDDLPDPSALPNLLLADFGLAQIVEGSESQDSWGTYHYKALEQWGTARPVFQTDQYQLAIMVYYLLTGQHPFEGTRDEVKNHHIYDPPVAPSKHNRPDIPSTVDDIILRALKKQAGERFSDINAFVKAFREACGLEPTPAPEYGRLLREYDVHASWVVAVDWEPGGNRLASAGGDGTVRVWEAGTGKSLLTYRGHTHWLNKINRQITVYTVAWNPKGGSIVSAGVGADVHVWDAETGQTRALYKGHSGLAPYVFAVAWSPDGERIASACSSAGLDKTVHLWDASTGQPLSRYKVPSGLMPNFSVLSLAWSPDGRRIAATCSQNIIRVWNTETEELVSTYHCGSEWVSHIAWSPDSRYLALAHSDHTAQVWDTVTEKKIVTYHEHKDGVRYVAWSPDGKSLATASNDRTVHIWEPLTGKRIYIYRGHSNLATSLAWSPDGTRIASASNDKTVQIWQAK
jgi:WD40 repeat protein/tRNA A-37 threonylcarbamoyl transferase component Bud32